MFVSPCRFFVLIYCEAGTFGAVGAHMFVAEYAYSITAVYLKTLFFRISLIAGVGPTLLVCG